MKQILIISGKGGTGKTVVTGALAALADNKVMVDCDVDAANLYLLLDPAIKERNEFRCGATAEIDASRCTRCDRCRTLCRFDAITKDFRVDPVSCAGCGLCQLACPSDAITMQENVSGEWFVSETRFGPFVHARLGIAEENSGKLVTLIKQKAKDMAEEQKRDWMIIDGAPGIGCPVIASLAGVDRALVVTEPTVSGLHDAQRVIEVARHFNVKVWIVINKYDLNKDMTETICAYARKQDIDVIGQIPFDPRVVSAMTSGKTVIEEDDSPARRVLIGLWDHVRACA